jgi:hypothetical protein
MTHTHENHSHTHSLACGHTKIYHNGHVDYIHDGHLHHEAGGEWVECNISISDVNPNECKPLNCGCNHEEDCGHEVVSHGDHYDYLVNGRLHHVHGDHCDDHGPVHLVTLQ